MFYYLDVVILLAMVVFMDQLSAQMPPMPDSVPIIGTVSLPQLTTCNNQIYLVFRGSNDHNYSFNRLNNYLSTATS